MPATEFNRVRHDDRSEQLGLDLGPQPVKNNEIVWTGGTNFRRRVRLEGSDNGKDWNLIENDAKVMHFQADQRVFDVRRIDYPLSRYRYLRVRVYPDPGNPEDRPAIAGVTVYQTTRLPGETVTHPATLRPREPVRVDGSPGSA